MLICKLKEIIDFKRMKKSRLAEGANVTRPFVQNLLDNKFKDLNIDSVDKVMKELKLNDFNQLFFYLPYEIEMEYMKESLYSNSQYVVRVIFSPLVENIDKEKVFDIGITKIENPRSFALWELSLLSGNLKEWNSFISRHDIYLSKYITDKVRGTIENQRGDDKKHLLPLEISETLGVSIDLIGK